MDDSLWRVVSIKINWWLRKTSWALFLPLKGGWNGSVVLARGWPVPGAAGDPCQTPAEPLSLFVPSVLGQDMGQCWMRSALWLYPVLVDVSRWDQKPWERVLVLVGREVSAQDLPQELGAGFGPRAGEFSILPFLLG